MSEIRIGLDAPAEELKQQFQDACLHLIAIGHTEFQIEDGTIYEIKEDPEIGFCVARGEVMETIANGSQLVWTDIALSYDHKDLSKHTEPENRDSESTVPISEEVRFQQNRNALKSGTQKIIEYLNAMEEARLAGIDELSATELYDLVQTLRLAGDMA